MSHIPSGGENIFIAGGASGNFFVKYGSTGWQGNTFVQGQPLNTGAALTCVAGSISLQPDGTYKFWTKISNVGNSTFFNLQMSAS